MLVTYTSILPLQWICGRRKGPSSRQPLVLKILSSTLKSQGTSLLVWPGGRGLAEGWGVWVSGILKHRCRNYNFSIEKKKSTGLFWSDHMVTYASHGIIPHLLLDVAIKERVWTLEYLEINVANKQVHYFAKSPFQLSSWMILLVTLTLTIFRILKIPRPWNWIRFGQTKLNYLSAFLSG